MRWLPSFPLGLNPFQQDAGRFVVGVLWDESALKGSLQYRLAEAGVRLNFHAGERVAGGLGLDYADGFTVGIEHVIDAAGSQRELPDGDARGGVDVHFVAVLDDPAALVKLAVDYLASLLFRCPRHGKSRYSVKFVCEARFYG